MDDFKAVGDIYDERNLKWICFPVGGGIKM